ncbi:MAG: pilin [Candidatus Paceibacterota bacterium]
MNLDSIKKYLLILAAALPVFVGAQTFSTEIYNINWHTPPFPWVNPSPGCVECATDTSITVSGTIEHTNQSPAPYQFQIEYGYPGFGAVAGTTSTLMDGWEVMGTGPLLNSAEYLDNQNRFGINVINLKPSQYYYFDIVEWNTAGNAGEPLHDYYIARTKKPEVININFSTFDNGSSTLSGSISLVSNYAPGVISGMPVGVYILSAPSTGDTVNENAVLYAFSTVVGSNGSFSMPITGLELNQQYYVQLVNEASGLPLMDSISFMFDDQNTPTTTSPPGGNGTTLPESPNEFENGIVNCDGINVACDFQKLLELVNRAIRFLIFVIGIPIVTLSFVYAGFLLVTSGGNPSKKDDAKKVVTNAVIGLVILLAAWLIVRTVLFVFGYSGPLLGILGAQ